jgi:flagellar basal-body rod protein FlgB
MDLTTEAVRLALNVAHLRAEVSGTNIAHVDLPGYRLQRADFGQAMGLLHEAQLHPDMDTDRLQQLTQSALEDTVHAAHGRADAPVQLDSEVAELETANVDFHALTTILSRRFALMQLAMAGRN